MDRERLMIEAAAILRPNILHRSRNWDHRDPEPFGVRREETLHVAGDAETDNHRARKHLGEESRGGFREGRVRGVAQERGTIENHRARASRTRAIRAKRQLYQLHGRAGHPGTPLAIQPHERHERRRGNRRRGNRRDEEERRGGTPPRTRPPRTARRSWRTSRVRAPSRASTRNPRREYPHSRPPICSRGAWVFGRRRVPRRARWTRRRSRTHPGRTFPRRATTRGRRVYPNGRRFDPTPTRRRRVARRGGSELGVCLDEPPRERRTSSRAPRRRMHGHARTHATAKISAEDSGNAADSPDHDNNSATAPARETRRDKGDDRRTRTNSEKVRSRRLRRRRLRRLRHRRLRLRHRRLRGRSRRRERGLRRARRPRPDRSPRSVVLWSMFANRTATRGHADPTSNDAAGESVCAGEQTPGEHRANGRDVRESDAPVPSRGGTDRVQQRVRHATPIGIRPGSNRRRRIDRGADRVRRRRRIRRSAEGHQARRRASNGGGDQRARLRSFAFEAFRSRGRGGGRRAAQIFVRDRDVVPVSVSVGERFGGTPSQLTERSDEVRPGGAGKPLSRPPPRALPPEATPRDWRARTRPRRRRNARRDRRVWRRRRPAASDRNRRPADPTRPSVPRARRDREPGGEEDVRGGGSRVRVRIPRRGGRRGRTRARKVSRRIVVPVSSRRRGKRVPVAFGLPGDVPPEDASRTYRTSSPSSSTSSLSGYITSNVPSGAVSSSNSSAVSFPARTAFERIAAEHGAHGSHLFGSTNPRERSRHTDAPSVDRRNGPINSAMSTPRSDARRTSRAASATRRVGTTSTSRNAQFGDAPNDPRRRRAVARGGSEDEPSEAEPSPGTCSASHGPNQWHFRVNTAHMRSEQPLGASRRSVSRAYVRRETRNSGRTDRPRATPGRARSRRGPSPTTREGGSRSRVPSVSFAPTIRPPFVAP